MLMLLKLLLLLLVLNPFPDDASIKIAMCQIFVLDGDRSGNLKRMENAIVEAKKAGAGLICFPETSLYGWVNPDAHKRACPIPGKDSDSLCALAKKHQVYLCAGLCEKEDKDLYDAAVLIDDKGKLLLKHRKINVLAHLMDPPYQVGKKVQAVDTPLGKVGLLICADTFKEDVLKRMAELKPDLVLVPYGWAAPEKDWPKHAKSLANVVGNTAKFIKAPVVGTNLVGAISKGPWKGFVYGGQSVAKDEKGQTLALAADRDKEIVVFTCEKRD